MRTIAHFHNPILTLMFLITLSFLFTTTTIADDNAKSKQLKKGDIALQFKIDKNFTLDNIQGAIFSGKFHTSNRSAIRLGFGSNFGYKINNDVARDRTKTDSTNISISFITQYIYYIKTGNMNCYLGAGPGIIFSYNKNIECMRFHYNDDWQQIDSNVGYIFDYNFSVLIGAEYFINNFISLSAEYGLTIGYVIENNKNIKYGENNFISYILKPIPVRFGLSFYL